MDLVTSFPIPPNYWKPLDEDEIKAMIPPKLPEDDITVFGTTTKFQASNHETASVEDIIAGLGSGIDSLLHEYDKTLKAISNESCVHGENLEANISAELVRKVELIHGLLNDLRRMQALDSFRKSLM